MSSQNTRYSDSDAENRKALEEFLWGIGQ